MARLTLRLLIWLALAAAYVVGCAAFGAPVPRPRPGRDLDAERARFPDPATVKAVTDYLWHAARREEEALGPCWGSWEKHRRTHPTWRAWFIWDDLRLYDNAVAERARFPDPEWERGLLDRVREWLGEENYRRGRLPPERWWTIPLPAERVPGPDGTMGR